MEGITKNTTTTNTGSSKRPENLGMNVPLKHWRNKSNLFLFLAKVKHPSLCQDVVRTIGQFLLDKDIDKALLETLYLIPKSTIVGNTIKYGEDDIFHELLQHQISERKVSLETIMELEKKAHHKIVIGKNCKVNRIKVNCDNRYQFGISYMRRNIMYHDLINVSEMRLQWKKISKCRSMMTHLKHWIFNLDKQMEQMPTIETLVPPILQFATNLIHLELKNFSEWVFLPNISWFPNLEVFVVNGRFHGDFPQNIHECPKLRVVKLEHTHVTGSLPKSIMMCKQLMILNINNTLMSNILPDEIQHCKELKELVVATHHPTKHYKSIEFVRTWFPQLEDLAIHVIGLVDTSFLPKTSCKRVQVFGSQQTIQSIDYSWVRQHNWDARLKPLNNPTSLCFYSLHRNLTYSVSLGRDLTISVSHSF